MFFYIINTIPAFLEIWFPSMRIIWGCLLKMQIPKSYPDPRIESLELDFSSRAEFLEETQYTWMIHIKAKELLCL